MHQSIHEVVETATRLEPDRIAVSFVDGPDLTRGELLDAALRVAGGLAEAGVVPGDRVAIMVTNRPEFLITFLAVSTLGAVSVPLNTALRGDVLSHMLESVGPCRLVADADLAHIALAADAEAHAVVATWCIGTGEWPADALPFGDLLAAPPLPSAHAGRPSDLASILFTSGTTGRSKGVMWSHRMTLAFSENASWVMGYHRDDVVYTCLPLFHINALFTAFLAALMNDAQVVVSPRFSASRYWQEIADSRATVTNMLGVIGAILWKQPPSAAEKEHQLRLAMTVPFPTGTHREFEERFGIAITELYGSTDTGIPLGVPHGLSKPGSCGIPAPGWQVSIVDADDRPVPPGQPGELVTRPIEPFVGQLGYWRLPDKTWEAHRNSWFHTGDQFTRDEEGWFYFQDRLKDSLRVSGENVSSFEVEQVILSHPDVAEAAVFAVPNSLGEDSVMVALVVGDGKTLPPEDLISFVSPRLPYFAVPRYVDILDHLPKTSTQKIQKEVLRNRGVTDRTWDGGQHSRGSAQT